MFIRWPFSKSVSKILSTQETCLWWMGATCPIWHEEILKTSSHKAFVRFWNNFTEMFHRWPFSIFFSKLWSVKKRGSGERELPALYAYKFLKYLLWMKRLVNWFYRDITLVTLIKNCLRILNPSKNMALANGGYLHYTDIRKFLDILLFRNGMPDFEMILWWPFSKIVREILICIQTWLWGRGATCTIRT